MISSGSSWLSVKELYERGRIMVLKSKICRGIMLKLYDWRWTKCGAVCLEEDYVGVVS
jgi:hypothetical protein